MLKFSLHKIEFFYEILAIFVANSRIYADNVLNEGKS